MKKGTRGETGKHEKGIRGSHFSIFRLSYCDVNLVSLFNKIIIWLAGNNFMRTYGLNRSFMGRYSLVT